ncbi:MAG: UDP-N-acetylmuramate dehydrogenase [Candidatus Saccharibacteria bacterium]|nr:UDP-N-acetylmuramate dehydrogenase [Candidatus Saccharibacteria bacterium]
MFVRNNVPLNAFSTMRLGGVAAHLVEVTDRSQAQEAVEWAQSRSLPFIVIGEGSNIIWRDEGFPGLVVVNKIKHFELYEHDAETTYVTAGGGENWDEVVERTVNNGLSGIETLSLIPGTAGATPVQNVGAYGSEISDVLMAIEAYDVTQGQLVTIRGSECEFAYRTSKFKTTEKNRYIITAITLRLTKSPMRPPFYASLQKYLSENNVTDYSPQSIRQAVIAIRSEKLPDPKLHANNGSFFQNPIVSQDFVNNLTDMYPDMTYWRLDSGQVKLSAAWLVERAGFKNVHDNETGMRTWEKQPLVLVNEHAKSTQDLLNFKQKIVNAVHEKFGIELRQEPELLP